MMMMMMTTMTGRAGELDPLGEWMPEGDAGANFGVRQRVSKTLETAV
jgi:hypothetical protein